MQILITGGTGTIGKALLKKFYHVHNIRIFSRDELKQAQLKLQYPDVEFMVGDVKDYASVVKAMRGIDIVIHAAAMKRIEICEQWPIEAVKTNILGTENVVNAALEKGIKKLVSIGSDKGVEPINVYGMTKAIQERITTSAGYNCARYGNVLGSRGSIVPLFQEQISKGQPITVTDPEMTRFVLTIDEALNIIIKAMESEMNGSIFVKKSPATKTGDVAKAMSDNIKIIGSFACEKKHEILVSAEEMTRVKEEDNYYIIQRGKTDKSNSTSAVYIEHMINKIEGKTSPAVQYTNNDSQSKKEYVSNTTKLLSIEEIKKYLENYNNNAN